MAEARIPVDLLNPGQVFSCLGILEAAELLLGDAQAAFAWKRSDTQAKFHISVPGDNEPIREILGFLKEAKIVSLVPTIQSKNYARWKPIWGEIEAIDEGKPFPFPDPASPATLPVILRDDSSREIILTYWGDATRRDNVKFWAGSSGKPGAAILRDLLDPVRNKLHEHVSDPFSLHNSQSNSFRFDPRSDYMPTHTGFSLNAHKKGAFRMAGYPLVSVFAAIGLTNARPMRIDKLKYKYGIIGEDSRLTPMFMRAALGAAESPVPGVPFRRFVMHLDYPGQWGQARCITDVKEEEVLHD